MSWFFLILISLCMEHKQRKEIKIKKKWLFGIDLILNHLSSRFPSDSLFLPTVSLKGRGFFSLLPVGIEEQQVAVLFGDGS